MTPVPITDLLKTTPSTDAIQLADALKRMMAADDGQLAERLETVIRFPLFTDDAGAAMFFALFGVEPTSILRELHIPIPAGERACRLCGCTESRACLDDFGDACGWVPEDHPFTTEGPLCTECMPIVQAQQAGPEAGQRAIDRTMAEPEVCPICKWLPPGHHFDCTKVNLAEAVPSEEKEDA